MGKKSAQVLQEAGIPLQIDQQNDTITDREIIGKPGKRAERLRDIYKEKIMRNIVCMFDSEYSFV